MNGFHCFLQVNFGFGIFFFFKISVLFRFSIFGFLFFFVWFLNAAQVFEEMLKLNFGLGVWNPIAYAHAMLFT